jgi:hypothetical protein
MTRACDKASVAAARRLLVRSFTDQINQVPSAAAGSPHYCGSQLEQRSNPDPKHRRAEVRFILFERLLSSHRNVSGGSI